MQVTAVARVLVFSGVWMAAHFGLAPPARAELPFPSCAATGCSDPTDYQSYLFIAPGAFPNDYDPNGGEAWKYAPDSGMDIVAAWERTTGRPDVVGAVLDSGIRWQDDADLARKVFLNTGELPVPDGLRVARLRRQRARVGGRLRRGVRRRRERERLLRRPGPDPLLLRRRRRRRQRLRRRHRRLGLPRERQRRRRRRRVRPRHRRGRRPVRGGEQRRRLPGLRAQLLLPAAARRRLVRRRRRLVPAGRRLRHRPRHGLHLRGARHDQLERGRPGRRRLRLPARRPDHRQRRRRGESPPQLARELRPHDLGQLGHARATACSWTRT